MSDEQAYLEKMKTALENNVIDANPSELDAANQVFELTKRLWLKATEENIKLRAEISRLKEQQPEKVHINTLTQEKDDYLPYEGYRGVYENAVHNWKNGLQHVMKRYRSGLIITDEGEADEKHEC